MRWHSIFLHFSQIPNVYLFKSVSVTESVQIICLICLYFKSPGGSASQVFAKVEVYLWLGPAKYCKEALNSLPEEFLPVYEEENEEEKKTVVPVGEKRKLPFFLSCQGESSVLEHIQMSLYFEIQA